MLRLIYVIIMRIGSIIYYVPKMKKYARHPERYSDEDCHELSRVMIRKVAKTSRITTSVSGLENIPEEGGFVLFSNHQSKFDALGIMDAMPRPCRVLMDLKRSKLPLANEYVALIKGKRLDRSNIRQQVTCIREMSEEVAAGKVYLIFPEGGYTKDQTNVMGTFYGGCFKTAIRAKAPVVPVALVDSWKTFGRNSLKKVQVQVHFLPPIPYEAYQHMTTVELARTVQGRIADKLREVTGEDVLPAASGDQDKNADASASV